MGTTLTNMVLSYQKTGTGYDNLLTEISKMIYRYPFRKYGWDEDECSDFYLSFFHRIPGLVERYKETGSTFESYLYSTVNWQMRTYIQKRKQESMRKKIMETEVFQFGASVDSCEEVCESDPASLMSFFSLQPLSKSMKKRFLFLILKGVHLLTEDKIERISTVAGISAHDLIYCVERLKECVQRKMIRLKKLRERRNKLFFRIQCLEEEIHRERSMSSNVSLLVERITSMKRKLCELQTIISKVPLYPTHREIADVLGVPKGTVDSGLFYLKTSFEGLYHDPDILYSGNHENTVRIAESA